MGYRGLAAAAIVLAWTGGAAGADREAGPAGLEFREVLAKSPYSREVAETGTPIPPEAVRVFTYEGGRCQDLGLQRVLVGDEVIGVDYGRSGVLFDRWTGRVVRRVTVADGWPRVRPAGLPAAPDSTAPYTRIVDPGVVNTSYRTDEKAPEHEAAATAEFGGRVWRALQPTRFLRESPTRRPDGTVKAVESWNDVLRDLDSKAFVEAAAPGGETVRYTVAQGLASNIVTHLVVAEGTLWAACVDIYDQGKKEWAPGGLCRFDAKAGRWERVETVAGRPVRWATLLQAAGRELWVGFREGDGLAGDEIHLSMGASYGRYRPVAQAVVLARCAEGQWTAWARDPIKEARVPLYDAVAGQRMGDLPPTEVPRKLTRAGDDVFLYSDTVPRGRWRADEGWISRLNRVTGQWHVFDASRDFGAHVLCGMIPEKGDLLATTDRGLHRWTGKDWAFMDTGAPLRNPSIADVAQVGKELWVGYTHQDFGVIGTQGISRYNEETGLWSWFSPQEIGTATPVQRIVPMPDGSVWVLFARRDWWGQFPEQPDYPTEPWNALEGLGRFAGGKWEFSVKLPGVSPPSRDRGLPFSHNFAESIGIRLLAGAGDKLFIATDDAVYEGPKAWKRIATCDAVWMQATADGRALEIVRRLPTEKGHSDAKLERGRYDPATGKVKFEELPADAPDAWLLQNGSPIVLRQHYGAAGPHGGGNWTLLPKRTAKTWLVGDLQAAPRDDHWMVETPYAVWIISDGELIRLDRSRLKEWLSEKRD